MALNVKRYISHKEGQSKHRINKKAYQDGLKSKWLYIKKETKASQLINLPF